MRKIASVIAGLLFAGCLTIPESQDPVHGAETGVIVHNYVVAFRDFLRTQNPAGLLPVNVLAPLPITETEWHAEDFTAPVPVTTTEANAETTTFVQCGPSICMRTIERTYKDGFRLDQLETIWYRRGVTTDAADDSILGFESTVRYHDQVVSRTAATEPTAGSPWLVTREYGFSAEDVRQGVLLESEYAALASTAIPDRIRLLYLSKEGSTRATFVRVADGWEYAQDVTYETTGTPVKGDIALKLAGEKLTGEQRFTYRSGKTLSPFTLSGTGDHWTIGGDTVALGKVAGVRDAKRWERVIEFPAGARFKTLTDTGTYLQGNRGRFIRKIIGEKETLTIDGTYQLKSPGVWEIKATGEGGIRLEVTYQSLDLLDVWAGLWTQQNASAAGLDTAEFQISAHPDWTTRMNYTYDRVDTPFTPDESGTLRMSPDTRGTARVSVVQEKAGAVQRHVDYRLRIVAEGQNAR